MTKYDVLVDSDAFIGFIVKHDAHHQRSKALFHRIIEERRVIVTTNYVITETASTLSRRFSQQQAKQFMQFANKILSLHITENLHKEATDLFQQQDKNKTSFVDMSNVVVMKQYEIPQILAFDTVYGDDFELQHVQ